MPTRSAEPVVNTKFDAAELIPYLESRYRLAQLVGCEFIRRGFNDHYLVTTGKDRFVFRIYFNGKYYISGADDFRFELDLLTHLSGEGVPVSSPIANVDGETLGSIASPAGARSCALFTFAEGQSYRDEPLTPGRARNLGNAVARFHDSADRFRTSHPRYSFDLTWLADEPLRLLGEALAAHGREGLNACLPRIDALKRQIARLPKEGPGYGIIHGDLHGGNYFFDAEDRPALFDFDHGGYGWRAYDVSVCLRRAPDDARNAFLAAYREIRPFSEAEVEVIPAFQQIRPLWDMGDLIAMRPAWGDGPADEETCDRFRVEMMKRYGPGAG